MFTAKGEGLPPPYEVEAYTYRRPLFHGPFRRPSLKKCLSALCLLSLVSYVCFEAGRASHSTGAAADTYAARAIVEFEASVGRCAARSHVPHIESPEARIRNPRWTQVRGQKETIALRNVSLFDGESFSPAPVDIIFSKGLVLSVSEASTAPSILESGVVYNLHGRFVTPGLVDMHSHHLAMAWPGSEALDDTNEVNALYGPLTPFLRVVESLKAYDPATKVIASGGITSSLIIPGSANIMGGEGTVVKNVAKSGKTGEYVVEEMLLEHGIAIEDRHRYMKFACGENPKRVYGHTRMANAYELRLHLTRAKELKDKQDAWCDIAAQMQTNAERSQFVEQKGGYPQQLKLESTIALIRGQVAMHNHCYEPEDLETMLGVMGEFGIHVKAFHHAIEAWQVPEMIKEHGGNITIATFAEASLYKYEAYSPSLYAGAILNAHGLPVAYKSDHAEESTNAKYVMSQAASGHAFHLPAEKALQAVTSIPAAAVDLSHRIGYVRTGYDADIVVWDSHPLSIGATPQQVFIDGIATLDAKMVQSSTGSSMESAAAPDTTLEAPVMRTRQDSTTANDFCTLAKQPGQSFIVHGIRKSFLDNHPHHAGSLSTAGTKNLTLVIDNGHVACLDTRAACDDMIIAAGNNNATQLTLQNGHLLPGLTAVTDSLGIKEISMAEETGNGVSETKDAKDASSVDYAKYGLYLDGKTFARARLGGVTRAITPPEASSGLIQGVSAAIRTSGSKSILNGGIVSDEVGLHANTQQIIALKKDFKDVYIVINDGHGAPMAAEELTAAGIPVILSATRPGPSSWDRRDVFVGPPLSRSPASILREAGVELAISVAAEIPVGDSRIHDLLLEASWAAKYAGLNEHEAIQLVSKKVEDILRLKASKDMVLWENNPLQWGASVVLSFEETEQGKLEVGTCWPDDNGGQSL
ncbi:hypothetical protein G7054_g12688 [Neopestalotiopsis clavispora]|nr:hypothetical protein G7054_g12688 [Neopestalotiopsis clavispora]